MLDLKLLANQPILLNFMLFLFQLCSKILNKIVLQSYSCHKNDAPNHWTHILRLSASWKSANKWILLLNTFTSIISLSVNINSIIILTFDDCWVYSMCMHVYVIVIPQLRGILLIYTPESRGPQARGIRVYISAKSRHSRGISDIYHSNLTW